MGKLIQLVLSLALVTLMAIRPLLGLIVIVAVTTGYVRPDWAEHIPGVTEANNIFRRTPWWKLVPIRVSTHLGLVGIVGYIIGVEFAPTIVALLGGGIAALVTRTALGEYRFDEEHSAALKWFFIGLAAAALGLFWAVGSYGLGLFFAAIIIIGEWASHEGILGDAYDHTLNLFEAAKMKVFDLAERIRKNSAA